MKKITIAATLLFGTFVHEAQPAALRNISRFVAARATKSASRKVFAATAFAMAAGGTATTLVAEEKPGTKNTKFFWKGLKAPLHDESPKLPIVYRSEYNISLVWGLDDYVYPVLRFLCIMDVPSFDGCKYGKIADHIRNTFGVTEKSFHTPEKVSDAELLKIHTPAYLASLKESSMIAEIAEIHPLAKLPNSFLQSKILDPMRYATQGTVEAVKLALKHGIGINLSGGYHHARTENQWGGFCFFADIPLAIKAVREQHPTCKKILVVDLDAHRGNGVAQARGDDKNTFIFDMFSYRNYPLEHDVEYLRDTDTPIPVALGTGDNEYLATLTENLGKTVDKIKPDLIIFNAGSDIYEGDALGRLNVTAEGIMQRDEYVFNLARLKNIPIAMTLSGGYSKESAGIVGRSIENILRKHCAELQPAAK